VLAIGSKWCLPSVPSDVSHPFQVVFSVCSEIVSDPLTYAARDFSVVHNRQRRKMTDSEILVIFLRSCVKKLYPTRFHPNSNPVSAHHRPSRCCGAIMNVVSRDNVAPIPLHWIDDDHCGGTSRRGNLGDTWDKSVVRQGLLNRGRTNLYVSQDKTV
jgi:hypothetical protein